MATESQNPSSAGAETLSELVARHARELKILRGAAIDPHAILASANLAADEIECRIDAAAPVLSETERAALLALQVMTFNAAADCWPGWEVTPAKEVRSRVDLLGGLDLARRSPVLVHRLNLGALREGTAHWMVGAYEPLLSARPTKRSTHSRWRSLATTQPRHPVLACGSPEAILPLHMRLLIARDLVASPAWTRRWLQLRLEV